MKLRAFNEDDLLRAVKDIHSIASVRKANDFLSGRIVFYVEDYLNRETGFNNTTIHDIVDLYGNDFSFSVIGNFDATKTVQYVNIRMANKKDFRGILKFTPKDTICMTVGTLGKNGYDGKDFLTYKSPLLQNQEILNMGEVEDIEKICQNYKLLTNNKSLVCDKRYIFDKKTADSIILDVHMIINNYFDVLNSWHIGYDYEDCTYLIPVDIEDLKDALKNREKNSGGRKPILPTIVNAFDRANGTAVKTHTRMSDNGFDLFGEHFYFVLGRDAVSLTYQDTNYGRNKLDRDIFGGKIYEYRNNEVLSLNKKGVGIGVFDIRKEN